ncbi:DUF6941 family protein [Brachybacterium squillarum]|uniref:DUF6941 family protein n=1 Tax=Brachybacterium squillarum TaxID=661979 RepID=UPI0022232BA2|nr:hypothetical protein [Brachybacterium squillarum]MCW1803890.1 hypothetical protein [Brachybacterium squillarum]
MDEALAKVSEIRAWIDTNTAERDDLEAQLREATAEARAAGADVEIVPALDYAFLAEHAQVASGKLNVMGASYTHLVVDGFPAVHTIAVAGRVRTGKEQDPVEVTLTFTSPAGAGQYSIEGSIDLDVVEGVRPYGDHVGLLFASNLQVVLFTEGLYEVHVKIDGTPARRLAFTVEARATEA